MRKPEVDFRPETKQKQTGQHAKLPWVREKVVADYVDSFPQMENNSIHF
jgi:hypothetical protein